MSLSSYPELAADGLNHRSDCARHNAPAYQPGACGCGAVEQLVTCTDEALGRLQYLSSELGGNWPGEHIRIIASLLKSGLGRS